MTGSSEPQASAGDPSSIVITAERPDSPDALRLILELVAHLQPLYPTASRHGFSVDRLLAEGVDFFVLRSDGTAAGCGGILFVGGEYAEIKRMYVNPTYRGSGFGGHILDYLAEHARARGVALLRLETGIHQREAIGLYERMGFRRIPPFSPYENDPLSLCYEKRLD